MSLSSPPVNADKEEIMEDAFNLPTHRYWGLRMLHLLSPATGRRRVWDAMSEKDDEIQFLRGQVELHKQLVQTLGEVITNREEVILDLEETIAGLKHNLELAIWATGVNANRIDFAFEGRPMLDDLDQATAPIDVRELREVMSEGEITPTKVTQVDPETGQHETVETPLPGLLGDPDDTVSPLAVIVSLAGHRLGKPRVTGRHLKVVTDLSQVTPTSFPLM